MTKKEIVDIYCRHIHFHRISGSDTDLTPILPFLVLDAAYTLYNRDVKPYPAAREAKMYRRKWMDAYTRFNRDFFSAFTPGQQDEIIEMMDSFWEKIEHHVFIAQIAVMEHINEQPQDIQRVVSAAYLCNTLAQAAQILWGEVYKDGLWRDSVNRNIRGIQLNTLAYVRTFHIPEKTDANDDKRIEDSFDILCKKIVAWLYDQDT